MNVISYWNLVHLLTFPSFFFSPCLSLSLCLSVTLIQTVMLHSSLYLDLYMSGCVVMVTQRQRWLGASWGGGSCPTPTTRNWHSVYSRSETNWTTTCSWRGTPVSSHCGQKGAASPSPRVCEGIRANVGCWYSHLAAGGGRGVLLAWFCPGFPQLSFPIDHCDGDILRMCPWSYQASVWQALGWGFNAWRFGR